MKCKEDKLVAHFAGAAELPKRKFPIGIGDDMAEVRLKSNSVLITTDMLLDGTHFDSKIHSPQQIGYKAMLVSLSDCAAMATVPVAAVAAVGLPKNYGSANLKKLHKGILKASAEYNCPLIGGDMTSCSGRMAITVTMLSRAGKTKPVKRSNAKAGDIICTTGTLGGSIYKKHLNFRPRIKEALEIAAAGANAMLDITDGLSSDLNRICEASGKGAIIYAEKIPLSKDAKKSVAPLNAALNDGEDFELLFTIKQKHLDKLKLPVYKIGRITKGKDVLLTKKNGEIVKLLPMGYDHFEK